MYYKITKQEAALIGSFDYGEGKIFSPFVNEQTDGCYIVSEDMYNLLKDTEQFNNIDWSGKLLISKNSLSPKPFII